MKNNKDPETSSGQAPEIIDQSTNELQYYSEFPIIYMADFYFSEHITSKKTNKIKTKNHSLKDQVYCDNSNLNEKDFFINRYKKELNVGKDSKLVVDKIILTKKISYSNIK